MQVRWSRIKRAASVAVVDCCTCSLCYLGGVICQFVVRDRRVSFPAGHTFVCVCICRRVAHGRGLGGGGGGGDFPALICFSGCLVMTE